MSEINLFISVNLQPYTWKIETNENAVSYCFLSQSEIQSYNNAIKIRTKNIIFDVDGGYWYDNFFLNVSSPNFVLCVM